MLNKKPDIGYIPTPLKLVDILLDFAEVTREDILYDLGCGDGRVLIRAAQRFGTRGVGIECDCDRITEANLKAKKAGVKSLVEFKNEDLFNCNFQPATVIFLYLLPHLNLRLRSQLWQQLEPGSRVISRDFEIEDWQCDRILRVDEIEAEEEATLYYWTMEAQS
ncbi:MAG: class I SAM-dependent methyltransferase [Cyanobacteria bacterium SBLK]|nr:class I SAM-dependent methyltransferase [Cyanobacteria bacterium SBLK]